MNNQQLKREITKMTNHSVDCWSRHDGGNWYESEARSGPYSAYVWDFQSSKREANEAALTKLLNKIIEE